MEKMESMDKICKMLQLPWMGEKCITEMISYSRKQGRHSKTQQELPCTERCDIRSIFDFY